MGLFSELRVPTSLDQSSAALSVHGLEKELQNREFILVARLQVRAPVGSDREDRCCTPHMIATQSLRGAENRNLY